MGAKIKMTAEQAKYYGYGPTADGKVGKKRKATPQDADAKAHKQRMFLEAAKSHGLPEPIPEYEWAKHLKRNWRADWLFAGLVIVEIVGGVWIRGHHSRGQSQIDDMVRRNEAQMAGYLVLEFTPQQIESGEAFPVIKRALNGESR